ncbi:DUF393 domain-containing protein [bacterium]|nr:DUF393 domain-containing protein [bacterium]
MDHKHEVSHAEGNMPIVFFDGICGFCNATINWLLNHDPQGKLRFAPLQGVTAAQLVTTDDRERLTSMVFWSTDGAFRKSSAVVRVLWTLGGIWSGLGTLLWLIPRPLRDLGYNLIARSRYRIFGKLEACRRPSPEEQARFLP